MLASGGMFSHQAQFEGYASEIIAVSGQNVETSFLAVEAFSNSITSYVKGSGQIWPNVTIGEYTSKATRTARLAGNGRIMFCPFVKQQDRLGFEAYVQENLYSQVQENLDFLGTNANATEVEGLYEQILQVDLATGIRTPEPYEGPDVQSEYLIYWQSVRHSLCIPLFLKSAHIYLTSRFAFDP